MIGALLQSRMLLLQFCLYCDKTKDAPLETKTCVCQIEYMHVTGRENLLSHYKMKPQGNETARSV